MATDTHTNGHRALKALWEGVRGKPMQLSAPTPTPTETPQARGARTRTNNNERFTNIEAEAAATRADMRTLLDMVRPLVQPSQPATTPQAPVQAAKPAAKPAAPRKRKAAEATTPRAQARGEFSPVNKRAVDIALAAKGCGCTVAYTRTIWAKDGLQPSHDSDGKEVRSIHYPNKNFAWSGKRIMQVWCAHEVEEVEQTGTDAPTPEVTAPVDAPADANADMVALFAEFLAQRS